MIREEENRPCVLCTVCCAPCATFAVCCVRGVRGVLYLYCGAAVLHTESHTQYSSTHNGALVLSLFLSPTSSGNIQLEDGDFKWAVKKMNSTLTTAEGRIVGVLEGGYVDEHLYIIFSVAKYVH